MIPVSETPEWVWRLAPLLVVAGWFGVMNFIAFVGGWKSLAAVYQELTPFVGEKLRFRSGQLSGFTNYGSCLTLGANHMGLHMSVVVLMRPGHHPLFIPWTDVSVEITKSWLTSVAMLRFARAPSATLQISARLAKELASKSSLAFTLPEEDTVETAFELPPEE